MFPGSNNISLPNRICRKIITFKIIIKSLTSKLGYSVPMGDILCLIYCVKLISPIKSLKKAWIGIIAINREVVWWVEVSPLINVNIFYCKIEGASPSKININWSYSISLSGRNDYRLYLIFPVIYRLICCVSLKV